SLGLVSLVEPSEGLVEVVLELGDLRRGRAQADAAADGLGGEPPGDVADLFDGTDGDAGDEPAGDGSAGGGEGSGQEQGAADGLDVGGDVDIAGPGDEGEAAGARRIKGNGDEAPSLA